MLHTCILCLHVEMGKIDITILMGSTLVLNMKFSQRLPFVNSELKAELAS